MAVGATRWTVLAFIFSRLLAVALFRNYGKMPGARVPGVHVPIIWTYTGPSCIS